MENTDNIKLPLIAASQAQKHITHNEALQSLDAIVQLSVIDRNLSAPPANPANGDRYIVNTSGAGDWLGHDGEIAAYQNNAWIFYPANEGWLAWIEDEASLFAWQGGAWVEISGGSVNPADMVGINTTADLTNKLSVKSDAVLFSHDDVTPGTGDIQTKLNKHTTTNNASFLFQTNWSGRAEIGLTGDDNFHFKVSADGASWTEAINIDAATGNVGVGVAPQNGIGELKIGGALQVAMQANAFNTSSPYTAFILGSAGSNGGLYAIARNNAANEPFTGLSGWDSVSSRTLYYGGGGWAVPDATEHRFFTAPSATETNNQGILRLKIKSDGTTEPGTDNAYSFGSASKRWSDVYSVNGVITTSDERLKTDIKESDLGLEFINKLRPVSFRWKVGKVTPFVDDKRKNIEPGKLKEKIKEKKGVRSHYGLIAQEVKEALESVKNHDFAGWTIADQNEQASEQGLRYNELIAPIIKAIQELSLELNIMKNMR